MNFNDDFDKRFDAHFNNFDKNFNRVFKIGLVAWVIGSLASLVLTGVVIWAIIALVQHYA